ELPYMALQTGERLEFDDFYKEMPFLHAPPVRSVCSGPVTYIGQEETGKDLADFRASLAEADVQPADAFFCELAPGWLEHFFHNEYYPDDEAYLLALADAMKHEYRAIVD